LAHEVAAAVERAVEDQRGIKQSPLLVGHEAKGGAAYDPKEPLPPRMTIPAFPPRGPGYAGLLDLESILNELDGLPPVKSGPEEGWRLRAENLPAFSAKVLAEYKPDIEPTHFRKAILKATELLRKHARTSFPDRIPVPVNDDNQLRAQLVQIQRKQGPILIELEEALDALADAGRGMPRPLDRSKRWQANYEYVMARMLNRLAFAYEYNSALGRMRRELPARAPADHHGWRLIAQEAMTGDRAGKDMAKDSRKILERLAQEHAGTPWQVLARREIVTALGLRWEPTRLAAEARPRE
jgi:hypothetical protein